MDGPERGPRSCPHPAHHVCDEEAAPGVGRCQRQDASFPRGTPAVVPTAPGPPGTSVAMATEESTVFAISTRGCKFRCCCLLAGRFGATHLNSLSLCYLICEAGENLFCPICQVVVRMK